MTCPRCGSEVSVVSARCRVCSAPLGRRVAASVLTPPPEANEQLTVMPVPADADDGTKVIATPLPAGAADNEGATYMPGVRGNRDDRHTSAPQKPPVQPDDLAPVRPEDAATTFEEAKARPRGDTGPLTIGQAFGNRYHIIKLLGIGGMGAVYQAWDDELAVAVAIKVIRPDVMADPHAAAEIERRFKRELLLARQVTHKNVVRIHDLGEIGGIKYITMPYVDGADLATVHRRDGRLPVSRVLHIARSVVGGLVEAHKAGVVHRDLKPANIMIGPDDDAMIMDFGIARSTGSPTAGAVPGPDTIVRNLRSPATHLDATVYGAVVGTVAYMAPEQAKGLTVDQRADIYAFGLILYDLLVGESRSTKAENALAELQARMKHAPPPVKTLVPEVSADVDRIITRCLEPDPDKRFQTSEELAAALALLDYEGVPIPIPPRFSKKLIASAATVVIGLVTATWYFTWTPPPPKQHDPVTVLIADFDNKTNDPTFDHTLEPMLKLALEGASFISAHDRTRIRAAFSVTPPEKFDEAAARQIGIKQAAGIVLSGSIGPSGGGYDVSLKAVHPITGDVVGSAAGRASGKEQVLATVTKVATTIRKALGDKTSDSAQLLAMRTISANSLDVVSQYAAGVESASKGNYEEARRHFLKAVELDPKFGLGYQGLATMSRNVGKLQESADYAKQAIRYLDGLTERERWSIRGNYYKTTGDYQRCAAEFGELIARYSADTIARNQRALCLGRLRNMRGAMEEMRQAVRILPNHDTLRTNLAFFMDYAGDFPAAEREVKSMKQPSSHALSALALSQFAQGRFEEATETFEKLSAMDAWGKSATPAGLGDLALYQGRFSEAARIFEQGAAADVAAKRTDAAAFKFASLAYVHLMRRQNDAAVAAADKALENSKVIAVQFLAGRLLAEAGSTAKALKLAAALVSELEAEPQAFGKIIEANVAMKKRQFTQAIKLLGEANGALDTWLGHFDLGRAYVEAGAFARADSEFDTCIKRRGEALELLDEDPTYGYFPPVYYYQGRAREGLQTAGFAASYQEYLKIRGKSTEDPLLPEVRKRAGN
jgi:serine/threonine protein kinase/tetratricopeptide (TPR) repeat protein